MSDKEILIVGNWGTELTWWEKGWRKTSLRNLQSEVQGMERTDFLRPRTKEAACEKRH